MTEKEVLQHVITILDKAVVEKVIIYNMQPITPYYSYSVIGTVKSSRQGMAAADYLRKEAPNLGINIRNFNAHSDSRWFLVDLNDVVVHLFVGEERERFNLDGLYWQLEKVDL